MQNILGSCLTNGKYYQLPLFLFHQLLGTDSHPNTNLHQETHYLVNSFLTVGLQSFFQLPLCHQSYIRFSSSTPTNSYLSAYFILLEWCLYTLKLKTLFKNIFTYLISWSNGKHNILSRLHSSEFKFTCHLGKSYFRGIVFIAEMTQHNMFCSVFCKICS